MKITNKCINDYELKKYSDLEVYLCSIDRKKFNDEDWNDFFDYHDSHTLNAFPNEPLTPREVRKKWFSEESKIFEKHSWLVIKKDTEEIIGRGALAFYTEKSPTYKENKDTAECYVDVEVKYRRRGLGTDLLSFVTKKAIDHNKKKFQSNYILDSTAEFCKKYKFDVASARNISRLYLKDVNWDKMNDWRNDNSKTKNVIIRTFEIVPEELLEEFCKVYTECGKMAPDYDGEYTACEQITPESLREEEKKHEVENVRTIKAISLEEDGTISGFTAIAFDEDNPECIEQDLTGVLPSYRGQGIVKRLKAEVILRLKENCPRAEFIETGNNLDNVAMLAINNQMNFKKHCSHFLVTAKVEDVLKAL